MVCILKCLSNGNHTIDCSFMENYKVAIIQLLVPKKIMKTYLFSIINGMDN